MIPRSVTSRVGKEYQIEAPFQEQTYGSKLLIAYHQDQPFLLKQVIATSTEPAILHNLDHTGVQRIEDEIAVDSTGQLDYLVFTYDYDETHLGSRLVDNEPLSDAANIACTIALILEYLDSNSVVHNDLKPGNIILGNSGLRLIDFEGAIDLKNKIRPGMPSWTPRYVAPEVCMGGIITPRSDIYSLGLLFYNMLMGNERKKPNLDLIADEVRCLKDYTYFMLMHCGREDSLRCLGLLSPKEVKKTLSSAVPRRYKDLIAASTALNPVDRPTAKEFRLALQSYLTL